MRKRTGSIVRTSAVVAALGAALAVGLALSSAASAKPAACSGAPLTFETIGNLSNLASQEVPELGRAVKAAAGALTRSCELGAPVNVVSCDDNFNPNDAAGCGRDAVSNKALAVFTFTGFADSFVPALAAAGIPDLPVNSVSAQENTNPTVFGLGSSIVSLIGQINIAASTGHKKLAIVVLDIPSVQFLVGIATKEAAGLGVTIVKSIPSPVTQTDMSGIAGQVISSGANAMITIVPTTQQVPLYRAVRQQGASSKQIAFVSTLQNITPTTRAALGSAAEGMFLSSWELSPSEASSPIVKQYVAELKAAGQPHDAKSLNMLGMTAWSGAHMLADALKAAKLPATTANVPRALMQPIIGKLSQKYGLNPLNYQQTAFRTDPNLKALRIFSSYQRIYQLAKGKVVPLGTSWYGVLHVHKVTPAE
jgi:ABC-type branched-subunit amino acid transport system substrate-binding protein